MTNQLTISATALRYQPALLIDQTPATSGALVPLYQLNKYASSLARPIDDLAFDFEYDINQYLKSRRIESPAVSLET